MPGILGINIKADSLTKYIINVDNFTLACWFGFSLLVNDTTGLKKGSKETPKHQNMQLTSFSKFVSK